MVEFVAPRKPDIPALLSAVSEGVVSLYSEPQNSISRVLRGLQSPSHFLIVQEPLGSGILAYVLTGIFEKSPFSHSLSHSGKGRHCRPL